MAEKKQQAKKKREEYRASPYGVLVSTSDPEASSQYEQEFIAGVGRNVADRARAAYGLATTPSRWLPEGGKFLSGLASLVGSAVTDPVGTGKMVVKSEAERARQAASSPGGIGEYAAGFLDPLRFARVLRGRAPDARELDVYHGTPHRFEPTEANPLGEFDASKIGTGEGAQAYGRGIYLAESPAVGRQYAEFLASRKNDLLDPGNLAASMMHRTPEGTKEAGLREIDAALKGIKGFPNAYPDAAQQKAALEKARELLESGAELPKQGGNFYTADLPDEMIDRMLDWDKPFNQQSPNAQKAIKDALEVRKRQTGGYGLFDPLEKSSIKDLVGSIGEERLRQAGIPGIKYLDAGSRGKDGTGTRNFVVFPGEEKKVKIIDRKNRGGMVENTTHDRKII
jgi:hypothetical protein